MSAPASTPAQLAAQRLAAAAAEPLAIKVRFADGTVLDRPLRAIEHQALQLQMLHGDSPGYVELTPGTRSRELGLEVDRRHHHRHFLEGPVKRPGDWLERLLAQSQRIVNGDFARHLHRLDGPQEEVFVGVAPRARKQGNRQHVLQTRFLWVDIDRPEYLDRLWALLRRFPAHMVVFSGGSGGAHAYWKLADWMPAVTVDQQTGERTEWIERAHARLIHHLGYDDDGKPVADRQCKNRDRVLRVAGTVNYKTGQLARIHYLDFHRPGYPVGEFIGAFEDPPDEQPASQPAGAPRRAEWNDNGPDPYKAIPAVVYYQTLTGRQAGTGLVGCPAADHEDKTPSCSLGKGAKAHLFKCHACGCQGGIYDMASAVLGGPTGRQLRDDAFIAARNLVVERFGDLRPQRRPVRRRDHHKPPTKEALPT